MALLVTCPAVAAVLTCLAATKIDEPDGAVEIALVQAVVPVLMLPYHQQSDLAVQARKAELQAAECQGQPQDSRLVHQLARFRFRHLAKGPEKMTFVVQV